MFLLFVSSNLSQSHFHPLFNWSYFYFSFPPIYHKSQSHPLLTIWATPRAGKSISGSWKTGHTYSGKECQESSWTAGRDTGQTWCAWPDVWFRHKSTVVCRIHCTPSHGPEGAIPFRSPGSPDTHSRLSWCSLRERKTGFIGSIFEYGVRLLTPVAEVLMNITT